jgi:hypothetical protein
MTDGFTSLNQIEDAFAVANIDFAMLIFRDGEAQPLEGPGSIALGSEEDFRWLLSTPSTEYPAW